MQRTSQAQLHIEIGKVTVAREPIEAQQHSFHRPRQRLLTAIHLCLDGVTHKFWGSANVEPDSADRAWNELATAAQRLPGQQIDLLSWKATSTHPAVAEAINNALAAFIEEHHPKLRRKAAVGKTRDPLEVNERALATSATEYFLYPPMRALDGPDQNNFSAHLLPGAWNGPNGSALREMTALQMGLNVLRLSKNVVVISAPDHNFTLMFDHGRSPLVGHGASTVAVNKGLTRKLLIRRGLPVAPGFTISTNRMDDAVRKAEELGFPLVVKPAKGSKGDGITTRINNWDAFHRALKVALDSGFKGNRVVVERHIEGSDFRFLSTGEKVLSVARRDRAAVVGNGEHTILELITEHNAGRKRVPSCQGMLVNLTAELESWLFKQGHSLDSVPERNERVYLAGVNNVSHGGVSVEVLDQTHPSLIEAANEAVRASGLKLGGVDMIIPDHRLGIDEQELAITEVNGTPSFIGHYFPNFGPGRDVFEHELRAHLSEAGLEAQAPTEKLCVRTAVGGTVTGVGFREWLADMARQLGVDGWVRHDESRRGIEAVLYGDATAVSVLVRRSIEGPQEATVLEVFTQQHSELPKPGFAVLDTYSV
ncbi:acylphosphatase [Natronoglycomyces albus]|uniref:Acylphosphatase n=1 Tax=Natronoglycomyces albus TaxID=2811108 RepID=A0A895XQH9_9ACTN|nr:acylphosphatase [Natronoglycomyces albus]QSB04816.1 acylphosphatase [Natronoglycomyces albus]